MRIEEIIEKLPKFEVRTIAQRLRISSRDIGKQLVSENLFRRSYKDLPKRLRRMVNYVFRHDGEVSFEELQRRRGATERDLEALQNKGLLFCLPSLENPQKVVMPHEFFFLIDLPDTDPTSLITGLKRYQSNEIKKIAAHLGVDYNQPKAACASNIYFHLLQNAESIANSLSPREKEIIRFVAQWDGVVSIWKLTRKYPLSSEGSYYLYANFSTATLLGMDAWGRRDPTPVQKLFLRGLLIPIAPSSWGLVREVAIPKEIFPVVAKEYLEEKRKKTADLKRKMVLPDPGKIISNAFLLQRDLKKIFLLTESINPRATQKELPYKTELKKASGNFHLDPDYLLFLFIYAKEFKLIKVLDSQFVLAEDATAYLNLSPDDQALLARRFFWEKNAQTGEFIDYLTGWTRRMLVDILEEFKDQFIKIDLLEEYARFHSTYIHLLQAYDDYSQRFKNLLRDALKLLFWLGFLEYSERMEAVRLSPLGRYAFMDEKIPFPTEEPQEERFVVQPNNEITALFNTKFDVLKTLALFCNIKSMDVSIIFSLDKRQLIRAVDRGMKVKKIIAFLEKGSKNPLPQPVRYMLEEVARREGEIELKPCGGYIKIRDPQLIPELKAFLQRDVDDVIGQEVIVLRTGIDLIKLEEELKRRGYFLKPGKRYESRRRPRKAFIHQLLEEEKKPRFEEEELYFSNPAYDEDEIEEMLNFAIEKELKVKIHYTSEDGSTTLRVIEPQGIYGRMISAYCHLREANRVFRLDRIDYAELLR